ncbi:PHD finger protein 7-like [Harpia harpyja]|uniref:PHD finger protein 7-like n=1 Tax=Harpia harpyja TaxID=202280 RepID=UPI0022B1E440|nr:PHD finger protein 7-like [Harpia harpyja]
MSARKQKAPGSMEQACLLCRRAEADPALCGAKLEKQGLCAHVFCLFFANNLLQQRSRDGVRLEDIRRAVARAARKHCFVCGESGATISCREMGCDRSFHLPCAVEGGCVTQFFGLYRAFCWEHRPEQAVEAAPEENTTCLICLDLVEERKSYGTMVCPACKHAWFHRGCIQNQAIHAGFSCFQCPHCQNEYRFLMEMLTMGIRIPRRGPSWEDGGAYEQLYERHSRCDARECLCPGGREQAEEEGPWQLLLCCSCAAEGTHRRCSFMKHSTTSWECDTCAGLGTASSASSELAGPSTASQAGSGPSHGSPAPDASSPSTPARFPRGKFTPTPVTGGLCPCPREVGPARDGLSAERVPRRGAARPARRCRPSPGNAGRARPPGMALAARRSSAAAAAARPGRR